MKPTLILFLTFLLFQLFFVSCKKDNKSVDNETQSVVDNALCEQEFMRISPAVSERAISTQGVKRMIKGFGYKVFAACPTDTLTGDTTTNMQISPYTGVFVNTTNPPCITLDWGTGCTDPADGVFRSGKLKSTFTKRYGIIGSQATVEAINYKINDITYSGTVKITRLDTGINSSFKTEVINGKCSTATWSINWATSKTVTWKAGYGTLTTADDVVEITGSSSGTNRDGKTFTVNIITPLEKRAHYKHLVKGTLEITPDGLKPRIVDFGNGVEDNIGTFTVNGNTFTFTMQ